MEEKELVVVPQQPEELTKEFLSHILSVEYGRDVYVNSFQAQDAEAGVLSRVVFVHVEMVGNQSQTFVAKFLKPEFPLEHMFEVESYFYRHVAPLVDSFQIPRPVYTSSSLIIMEHVSANKSYSAVEGCPKDLVVPIVTRLGQLHAQFLGFSEGANLAVPAGIGSTATGITKETHFPGMWKEFLDNIPALETTTYQQVSKICHQLTTRRLSDVHDHIHNHAVQTLIHGDFHVANMILVKDNVWLVDWAACGRGNPFIDLAFFSIVCLDTNVRHETENAMLLAYYEAFYGLSLTLEACRALYRTCLLNQFFILVVYDRMARGIAKQASRTQELTNHFNVVNARACRALVDNFGQDLLPRLKTKEEAAMKPQGDVGL
jgi:thiamine kinase-like enzyme